MNPPTEVSFTVKNNYSRTISQVRHKDEYIAELEARLEREVTEVAQVSSQSSVCVYQTLFGFLF